MLRNEGTWLEAALLTGLSLDSETDVLLTAAAIGAAATAEFAIILGVRIPKQLGVTERLA